MEPRTSRKRSRKRRKQAQPRTKQGKRTNDTETDETELGDTLENGRKLEFPGNFASFYAAIYFSRSLTRCSPCDELVIPPRRMSDRWSTSTHFDFGPFCIYDLVNRPGKTCKRLWRSRFFHVSVSLCPGSSKNEKPSSIVGMIPPRLQVSSVESVIVREHRSSSITDRVSADLLGFLKGVCES